MESAKSKFMVQVEVGWPRVQWVQVGWYGSGNLGESTVIRSGSTGIEKEPDARKQKRRGGRVSHSRKRTSFSS